MVDSWDFMITLRSSEPNAESTLCFDPCCALSSALFSQSCLVLNPLLPPSFYCLFTPYASEKRINDAGEERENVKRA